MVGHTGVFTWQLILEKENSEFKPVKLCLKINLVLHLVCSEKLLSIYIWHLNLFNCIFISFCWNYISFFFSFLLQHFILALKALIAFLIPDVPKWVQLELARSQFEAKQAVETLVSISKNTLHCPEWNNVLFFFCLSYSLLFYFLCLSYSLLFYFLCLSYSLLFYFLCLSYSLLFYFLCWSYSLLFYFLYLS